jgi:hypothetical protein
MRRRRMAAMLAAWAGWERTVRMGMAAQAGAGGQACELRAALQAGRGGAVLGYEFRNLSAQTAYLFNVLARTGAGGGLEADGNLVYVEAGGGRVLLSKKIIAVPRGMRVEKPEVPYVTRVAAGESFREKLELRLPLEPWSPYVETRAGEGEKGEPVEMETWFELGYFLAAGEGVAREAGGRLEVYPFPVEKQMVLRKGPLGMLAVWR